MSEAYFTNWLAAHANDERNHFHHVALHEARVATDVHARPAAATRTSGLVDRLRAAFARAGFAGTTTADRCDCPVAA
jgi:hypothetical protein